MRKFKTKFSLLIALLFVSSTLVLAQEANVKNNNELWTGFVVKHKLNKSFRLELEQQVRLNENWSHLNSTFFELGVRYKISKYFALKPQVRYVFQNGTRNRYRLSLDATADYKLKSIPLMFYYRARFQNTTVTYTKQQITYLRNQLGVKYKINKWLSTYSEIENFYRFNDKHENRGFRIVLGTKWRLSKTADLNLYFQIDSEQNVEFPSQQNVLGIKFSFDI